jgi:LPS-assembly protein
VALLGVGAVLGLLLGTTEARAIDSIVSQKTDKNAPITFQADEVEYDDKLALTIAKGHVEISQSGQVLLADQVTYNQRTDTVTASGHVSFILPTGEVMFADFMELRDSMNNAFAENVRMLMSDRSRLAANAARRINANRIELRRGVYSPCDLCKKDPTAPPAWQLRAREISDDKELKLTEFRDAVMEIDGVPVFYTPYLSEPEPSVKRASGFLTPSFGNSNTVGFHFSLPYYWVIDQDKDLTLAPRFTSRAGPLLASEYRQRFGNGTLDAIGSLNYSNVGSGGVSSTGEELRGHINAGGVWDLDDTYRTGFQIQRASDQTYLLRFGFGNPLLNALISRAYLEGFEQRASTDVNAYVFQPLTPGLGDSTQPIVLPVINRDWQSEPGVWGGLLKANANILNIVREVGTQTRRLSLGGGWERTFRDGIGGQYKFTATVRGDAYSVSDLSSLSNPDLPTRFFSVKGAPPTEPTSLNFLAARAFPQLGLTWSYPLVHRGETIHEIIEPIAGIYAGPNGGNRRNIPDEDSLGYVPARPAGRLRHSRYRAAGGLRVEGRHLRQFRRHLPLPDRTELPRRVQYISATRIGRCATSVGRRRPYRAAAQFVSRPDLPIPIREEQPQQPHPGGRRQCRAIQPAGRRQFPADTGGISERCRYRPNDRSDGRIRQTRAADAECHRQADALLVADRQRDGEPDQFEQPGERHRHAAIEQ